MKKICSLVFLFIFALPNTSYSFLFDFDFSGLKGIDELSIIIQDLDSDALDVGLSKERLRKTIELKLLMAGIKINKSSPVYISYSTLVLGTSVGDRKVGYAIYHSLSLNQSVELNRDPSQTVLAVPTWQQGSLLMVSPDSGASSVKSSLENLLDDFVVEYLKANPK